jgi:hypothetical protein
MHNVIITGMPRGGTTLASALIDGLPDTVCLNEPDWQTTSFSTNPMNYAKWLVGDFVRVRRKLERCEPIPERRAADGAAVTNYYSYDKETGTTTSNYQTVRFTRSGLTREFNLAIKHNGPFLGALPSLVELEWFTIIAIVRHPIPVIHSWRSLQLPVSRGQMPNAVGYWQEMAQLTAAPMGLLEKQVRMYDLICRRLYELRGAIRMVPYEAIIENPQILTQAAQIDGTVNRSLIGSPSRDVPTEEAEKIREALEKFGEYWRYFYTS